MVVLSLFLGGEEDSFGFLAPLLLGGVNTRRRRRLEHRAASVVVFLRLGRVPSFDGRANLTRELTEQTEDDRSRIVDVNRTYGDKRQQWPRWTGSRSAVDDTQSHNCILCIELNHHRHFIWVKRFTSKSWIHSTVPRWAAGSGGGSGCFVPRESLEKWWAGSFDWWDTFLSLWSETAAGWGQQNITNTTGMNQGSRLLYLIAHEHGQSWKQTRKSVISREKKKLEAGWQRASKRRKTLTVLEAGHFMVSADVNQDQKGHDHPRKQACECGRQQAAHLIWEEGQTWLRLVVSGWGGGRFYVLIA